MKLRQRLFRLLFGAESRKLEQLERDLAETRGRATLQESINEVLSEDLKRLRRPAPARLALERKLTDEQIAEALGGTEDSPVVQAILEKIAVKLVQSSDRATDAPAAPIQTREGIVPGFTNDDRLYLSGGSGALAELLRELQEAVKPRAEVPTRQQ